MSIDHDFVEENVDAWAIGALDAQETAAIDDHIATCTNCLLLADDARETAAALALAVPLVAAPADLKARVVASASILQAVPASKPRTGYRWWAMTAAASITIIGIGALSWGTIMQRQVNDLQSSNDELSVSAAYQTNQYGTAHTQIMQASATNASLTTTQDAMLEIVGQPDVEAVPLAATTAAPQASARYVWSQAGKLGALITKNLPTLDAVKTYCLWTVYDNAWKLAGLFNVDETGAGRLVTHEFGSDAADGAFRGLAVTIEAKTIAALKGNPPHSSDTVLRSFGN